MMRIIYIWIIIMVLSSCYENQDGCLDVRASNYDISADIDCDDCCNYPNLVLSVTQKYNGEDFNLGDTLETDTGEPFVLIDYLFLLSNVEIKTPDGAITVLDSLLLSGDEGVYIKRDLANIQRGLFQYTLGSFIYEGAVTGMSLDYGISEKVDEKKVVSDSYFINSDTDSLYNDTEYIIHRIEVAVGAELMDTVIYNVGQHYGRHSYEFLFVDAFSTRGDVLNPVITADYGLWFRDIDFTKSQLEVEEQLYKNSMDFMY